jgi:hypothetical protein
MSLAGRVACGTFLALPDMNVASASARTELTYTLDLRDPACFEGADEDDQIKSANRIHVFALKKSLLDRLQPFIGKIVVVYGNPFGEHTAHHHAPIVKRATIIDRQ